jgi:hypothetical protein
VKAGIGSKTKDNQTKGGPFAMMSQGGNMGFDKAHKLLYSSNLDAGLWRVVFRDARDRDDAAPIGTDKV